MACGVFLFFPIQQINDFGLGVAANTQTSALTSNGVPNDVLVNINVSKPPEHFISLLGTLPDLMPFLTVSDLLLSKILIIS